MEPSESLAGVLADSGDGNTLALAAAPGGQKRPAGYVARRPPLTVPT